MIADSLVNSPTLAAAKARQDAADAALEGARAERMPSASVQGQVGAGWIDPQGFFGLTADDVMPRSGQVTVTLPVYTGGRVTAGIRQAEGGRAVARSAAHQTALETRVQVVRAYTQALAAAQEVESYSAMSRSLAEALRQANLKFQAGDGTSTEIAQAEARLAEAQAGLASAQGSRANGLVRLRLLAGHEVAPLNAMPPPPPHPATADEAAEQALTHSPALEQARKGAEIAQASISAARAEGLPTVGLYAEGASVRDQFFPGYKAESASVGVRASWAIFSGGRVAAKVRQASAEARAASSTADAAALEIEAQARQGFAAVESARAVLAASQARSAAANEALRGTRLEVSVGAKPQLALLDAEREAIAADTALIAAEGQLLVAAFVLRTIVGEE